LEYELFEECSVKYRKINIKIRQWEGKVSTSTLNSRWVSAKRDVTIPRNVTNQTNIWIT